MSEFPRKTVESFVDHRFGFPVELQNVELIQVFDDWLPDVNANALREAVFAALVVKPARWTGAEVRFVRLSQRMTQTEFAELVDVTHPAVSTWESSGDSPTSMGLPTEFMLRFKCLKSMPDLVIRLVDRDGNAHELSSEELATSIPRVLAELEKRITPAKSAPSMPVGPIDGRNLPNPGNLPIGDEIRV